MVSFFAVLGDSAQTQELRRTSWSRAFGRSCHTFPYCSEGWEAYAQTEARSMIVGAIAFFIYALCVSRLLVRHKLPDFAVTASSILTWMAAAFGLSYAVLR